MKIKLLFFLLVYQCSFAQLDSRKIFKGQVRNELLPVENVIIFNTNSKVGVVVDKYGNFEIPSQVYDTLVFSSLAFKSKKIVLSKKEFTDPLYIVNLELFTNELAEVIIRSKKELNPLISNSQTYVDMQFFDDVKSSPKNRSLLPNGTIENGINFVRVYKDVLKVLRKNNPGKTDFYNDTSFSELVIKRINYSFFTNTLKLDENEIKLFLVFCENDQKSRTLLHPKDEFQLIDFLVAKNKEYKKITAF